MFLNICKVSDIWSNIEQALQNVIFKLFSSRDLKSYFYLVILKCFHFALLCLPLLVFFSIGICFFIHHFVGGVPRGVTYL